MIEGIARRDRLVVLAGLVVAAALAWLYLIDMALDMGGDMAAGSGAMMRMQAWSLTHGLLMWAMWAVMMVAMMVPSAAPMILIFARVDRSKAPAAPTPRPRSSRLAMWRSGRGSAWPRRRCSGGYRTRRCSRR